MSFDLGEHTSASLGYEHFSDERIADRGVPSFHGRPLDTDPSTFFGNAALSPVEATVDAFNALIEHEFGNGVALRNRSRWADYDKVYQNVFPGAVNGARTAVRFQGDDSLRTFVELAGGGLDSLNALVRGDDIAPFTWSD